MLNAVRSCSRFINLGGNNRGFALKKPKLPGKVEPVFQYPTSDPSDRRVYVWGLAEHGALGIHLPMSRHKRAFFYKPKRMRFAEEHKVTDVECGYGFTIYAVRSEGQILAYGSGINTDSQLGISKLRGGNPEELVMLPKSLELPFMGQTPTLLGLAAGRAHSLLLTTEGVFSLGNNAYGQCGRPIITDEDYQKSGVNHRIPHKTGDPFVSVVAGQDHSILLTESGQVYAFGWGADGQTGLAHYRNEHKPSLVKGDLAGQKIVKVACVADCVLALNDRGKLFGWGNSEYGQLPTKGDYHQINTASEIEACTSLGRIVDIAAGGSFCMVLNEEGKVYVWGYGLLGLGPEVQRAMKPTLIPPTLFGANAYQPETKVSQISCGISQLAAVTNTGDLYMWGRNKHGALGLGHENDQFFPLKVAVGARVIKVSCGVDHTVVLCKPYV